MAADDDDWTGTPPEGRHPRDKAKPDHWKQAFPVATAAGGILGVLFLIVVVLALT